MTKKQMLLMLVCCLVPIVGALALFVFNVPLNKVLLFALVLFCPLSHILMMFMPGHAHTAPSSQETEQQL